MTNLTSAQMWPFVWRQCLRTTPRAPDRLARTCMSRRRSMPILRLGFWSGTRPRRWRGATAAALRGFRQRCGVRAQVSAAHFGDLSFRLLLWLGKRRRHPNRCAVLSLLSFRPRAACQACSMASFWALFCLCCAETMSSMRRNQASDASNASLADAWGRIRGLLEASENASVFYLG